jgi:hypothetical protein
MSRKTTLVAAAGAVAMIVGTLGPWMSQQSPLGPSTLPGTDYGGAAVIVLALLIVLLAAADRPTLVGVCGLTAALWIGIVMYGAPGALTSAGAWEAHIAWGAYLSFAGCLVVLAAASARERALAQAHGAHHAAVVGRPEA